jgi:hypothetical protein
MLPIAALFLVVVNTILLFGVLFVGWILFLMMFPYWLETGIFTAPFGRCTGSSCFVLVEPSSSSERLSGFDPRRVAIAALALLLSHGLSFFADSLGAPLAVLIC